MKERKPAQSFKDLVVWQKVQQLICTLSKMAKMFVKGDTRSNILNAFQ